MGEAIVEILLAEVEDSRTQVTLREAPSAGPAKFLDNPVLRWMLKARNVETLSRLADRVENRPSAA